MSARRAPKARRSPRRKAGRAAVGKAKPTTAFRLTIEAQEMHVSYTPDYFAGSGHFAFRSPHEPPRRIPVSETGYLSHFAPMEEIEAASSPQEYARMVAIQILHDDDEAASGHKKGEQLSLF